MRLPGGGFEEMVPDDGDEPCLLGLAEPRWMGYSKALTRPRKEER